MLKVKIIILLISFFGYSFSMEFSINKNIKMLEEQLRRLEDQNNHLNKLIKLKFKNKEHRDIKQMQKIKNDENFNPINKYINNNLKEHTLESIKKDFNFIKEIYLTHIQNKEDRYIKQIKKINNDENFKEIINYIYNNLDQFEEEEKQEYYIKLNSISQIIDNALNNPKSSHETVTKNMEKENLDSIKKDFNLIKDIYLKHIQNKEKADRYLKEMEKINKDESFKEIINYIYNNLNQLDQQEKEQYYIKINSISQIIKNALNNGKSRYETVRKNMEKENLDSIKKDFNLIKDIYLKYKNII